MLGERMETSCNSTMTSEIKESSFNSRLLSLYVQSRTRSSPLRDLHQQCLASSKHEGWLVLQGDCSCISPLACKKHSACRLNYELPVCQRVLIGVESRSWHDGRVLSSRTLHNLRNGALSDTSAAQITRLSRSYWVGWRGRVRP